MKTEAHPDICNTSMFFSLAVKFLTSKCALGGASGFALFSCQYNCFTRKVKMQIICIAESWRSCWDLINNSNKCQNKVFFFKPYWTKKLQHDLVKLQCRMFLYLDCFWVWWFCWLTTSFLNDADGHVFILIPQRENRRFITKWRKQELGFRAMYWVSCPEYFHVYFFWKGRWFLACAPFCCLKMLS